MSDTGGYGQLTPSDSTSDFATDEFHIDQKLLRVRTNLPVIVKSVQAGGLSKYSTCSVQPLIKQIDGLGNATSHGEIFNIPVMRWGGGDSSIIMDPAVGDLGYVAICDRDISAFKSSQKESQPGSFRTFDFSDSLYLGKLGGSAPAQYILFDSNGIQIVDRNSNKITMKAGEIDIADNNGNVVVMKAGEIDFTTAKAVFSGMVVIDGALQLGGPIEAVGGSTYAGALQTTGDVIAGAGGGDSVTLQNHLHTSASSGSPTSVPTAGT